MSDDRASRIRESRQKHREKKDQLDTDEQGSSDDTSDHSGSAGSDDTSSTDKSSRSADTGDRTVKDLKHVNMYLEPELAEEIDDRFNKLNARRELEDKDQITKNYEFYPAFVRAALNGDIEGELADLLGEGDE